MRSALRNPPLTRDSQFNYISIIQYQGNAKRPSKPSLDRYKLLYKDKRIIIVNMKFLYSKNECYLYKNR